MKAKDSSQSKKRLEEALQQYEEKGFVTLPDGQCLYELKTMYGKVMYIFNSKYMEDVFARIALDFLAKLEGVPTTIGEIKEKHKIPEEQFIDVTLDLSEEIVKEFDEAGKSAIKYFMENLPQLFIETFCRIVEETFCLSLLDRSDKGYFTLNATQSKVFDNFFKAQGKQAKERMGIRKSSGAKRQWTEKLIEEAAALYDTTKDSIDQARKKQKEYQKRKNIDWVKALKEDFPELSLQTIEQIGKRGIEPSTIAIQVVLTHFGKDITEGTYLKQLLRERTKKNKEKI